MIINMKYNILRNWKKENNQYNWEQWCNLCKQWFEEDEKFTRIDIETSCMRWDDKVYCFHNKCFEEWKKNLLSN